MKPMGTSPKETTPKRIAKLYLGHFLFTHSLFGLFPHQVNNMFQFKRRTAWRSHFNIWLAMLSNFVLRPFIGDDKSDFLPVTGKQCFKFQYLIHSKLFYVRVLLELHFAFVKFLRIFSPNWINDYLDHLQFWSNFIRF